MSTPSHLISSDSDADANATAPKVKKQVVGGSVGNRITGTDRTGGSTDTGSRVAFLLRAQQSIGNRAVSRSVAPTVSRCGGEVHEGCDCATDAERPGGEAIESTSALAFTVQRGLIDDLRSMGYAAAGVASAAAHGLTDVVALARDLPDVIANPSTLPAFLVQHAWHDVPTPAKARLIDSILAVCTDFVAAAPTPQTGEGSFAGPLFKRGCLGFLRRAMSFDDAAKVRIVDRMIALWANPTPSFTIGFLEGLLLGLWDGLSGPFVLLWDIVKLDIAITEAEARLLGNVANADRRHAMVAQLRALEAAVEARAGQAARAVWANRANPAALMSLVDAFVEGVMAQAENAGSSIADSLLRFLDESSDHDLGHAVGRVEGNLLFEVLLLVLTDGGYTAIKAAVEGTEWIAAAIRSGARVAGRVSEALAPVRAAIAAAGGVLRRSEVVAAVLEGLEEILTLLIDFLKVSYGLEAGVERAGSRATREAASEVRLEEHLVDEASGQERTLRLLGDGVLCITGSPCTDIAVSILERFERLPGGVPAAGELAEKVARMRGEATAIRDAGRAIEAEVQAGTRSARQAETAERELMRRARALETEMEGLEREQRVYEHLVTAEGFTPLGRTDEEVRAALGLGAGDPCADFVGERGGRWLVSESKGSDVQHAVEQVENTVNALTRTRHVPAADMDLVVYLRPAQFAKLARPEGQAGYFVEEGFLAHWDPNGTGKVFQLVNGNRVRIAPAP